MANNRTVADLLLKMATKGGKTWLEQKGFGLIRPFIKRLVKAIPALVPDTPLERVLMELYAMVPGFIEAIWPENTKRNAIIADIFREAIQELGLTAEEGDAKDKPKTAKSGGASAMERLPSVWMNSNQYPGLAYHGECPARHHFKMVTKKRKKDKGPEEEYQEEAPRPGFRPFSFESFAASGARAPEIEGDRDKPGDVGELFVPNTCACATLFERDKKLLEERKEPSAKKGSAAKEDRSVTGYIGKATAGKIAGVDQAKIDRLMGFLILLSPAELVGLDEINSEHEFVALATATTIEQFKMLIAASKDRKARGILADLLGVPASVVHTLGGAAKWTADTVGPKVRNVAAKGEAVVRQLPGKARVIDGKLAKHAQRVGDEQERLLEIERFARKHRIKNVSAFKADVLTLDRLQVAKGNIDLSTIDIPTALKQFGRRA